MYIYKLCTERSFRCLRRQRQRAEKPAFDAADDDDGNEVVVVAALKFFEFFVFFFSFCHIFALQRFRLCFFIIWRLFSVALFTDNTNKKKKKKKKKLSWNNTNTNNTNSQPHHVLQTGQTIAQTREGRKRHVLVIIVGTKQNSEA